jgi:hypothetical protein
MLPRLELRYPENDLLAPGLTWVEPSGLTTGYPVLHIKHRSQEGRLFGEADANNATNDPSLIPHELAHALHFSLLPANVRVAAEARYAGWIAGRVANGQPPFHNTTLATDPFVAYIEALGLFSERFFFFAKRVRPDLSGAQLRQAFFRDELSANPALGSGPASLQRYTQVGRLNGTGNVAPTLTGDDVEGAVYGAIFLDFARREGLREAVGHVMRSKALEFDDWRNFVIRNTALDNSVTAVANAWGL